MRHVALINTNSAAASRFAARSPRHVAGQHPVPVIGRLCNTNHVHESCGLVTQQIFTKDHVSHARVQDGFCIATR